MTNRAMLFWLAIASAVLALHTQVSSAVEVGEDLSPEEGFSLFGLRIGFQPRVDGGAMYYEYTQEAGTGFSAAGVSTRGFGGGVGGGVEPGEVFLGADALVVRSVSEFEISGVLPIVGVGGTFFVERFFVDVYAAHAFEVSDTENSRRQQAESILDVPPGGGFSASSNISETNTRHDVDFDRTEWQVSAGYAFTDHFAVYAGYKRATTDFDQDVLGDVTLESFNPNSAIRATGTVSFDVETEFEQDGPFVGATYGVPVDLWIFKGLVSANVAVAFLDGEVENRTSDQMFNLEIRDTDNNGAPFQDSFAEPNIRSKLEGDAVGLSLGISWRGATPVKGLSYSLGVQAHKYEFDGDKATSQVAGSVERRIDEVDFDETAIYFRSGLSYLF